MARNKTVVETEERIEAILRIKKVKTTLRVLFTSPLIMNRLPKKAQEHLLLPPIRKNKASREATLKHDPPAEFRDLVYRCRDDKAPTLIHLPDNCFKKAMAAAAVDIPGATKAQIGRLVSITSPTVHLYGRPFLYMTMVRQAGISRTPDIRTRAIFPQAACEVEVQYIERLVNELDILNLFVASGTIIGVGDGRTEKGSSDFGQYTIVTPDDRELWKDWQEIMKQGRRVQEAAMQKIEPYDDDSEELLAWYETEVRRREHSSKSEGASSERRPGRPAAIAGRKAKANSRGHVNVN